ncbi:extracellular solute-binding protein [Paenibacillus ferrarius]|uniref:extracellular solute-binding protein n=1 Tax=Paenibacillus ferrarius TaxID=1469647 RepID=UPI003D28E292
MKKQLRTLTAGVAVLMLGTILAACGNENPPKAGESKSTEGAKSAQPLKEVTLKIFLPGDDKPAKAEVLQALYEKTKDKLNAKFEINFVPFGDYQNKMTLLASSGDNYDAAFTADWFGFANMVNKGAFLDVTELAQKYAPNLYKTYKDNNFLADASVNGKMYALPWTEIKTSKPIFKYRKDIADKLNVKPGDLSTLEGIDAFLTEIAKANPGMTPFDQQIGGPGLMGNILAFELAKYELQNFGFHDLVMDLNDPAHKLVPVEQTQAFKEAVKLAKKWYDAGIIDKNAISEKNVQLYENSKAFSVRGLGGEMFEKTNFTDKSAVLGAAEPYADKKFTRDSQINNAIAINKNAANPERMLMFIELLSTDKSVYDLFMYGIKDKTYSVDDKGVIGFAKGEDPAKPQWQNWSSWGFWRTNLYSETVSRPLSAVKQTQAFSQRPNIVLSPIAGFVPSPDAIKTELAQRDQIESEQGRLLLAGVVKGDVDQAVSDYIAKQKTVGLDKVLAETQKQVDEFLKNKK